MSNTQEETPGLARKEIDFTIFYQNMRTLRLYRNISSKQASIDCGLKLKSRWEAIEYGRGVPSMLEFYLICKFLGQSMDDMLNKVAKTQIQFQQ